MDAERRPREPRPGVRRLRDISHLYISSSRHAARAEPAPQAAVRRRLRLVIAGPGSAVPRSAVGANLAVQFARLGRRTLVVDLDPALPGIGSRLGLAAADALAHVAPAEGARVARGFLGIRVLCGVAGQGPIAVSAAALQPELGDIECVIVQVPAAPEPELLRELGTLLPVPGIDSTLARVAAHSPMIGAWLATAQRPVLEPALPPTPVDVALWVVDGRNASAEPPPELQHAAEVVPRRVLYGEEMSAGVGTAPWGRVPRFDSQGWLPVSLLDPAHPAARAYEGLAQAVLAASSRPGGGTHA